MLDENSIKESIARAFTDVMNDKSDDRQGAVERVAGQIARAVVQAIRSAEVVYTGGLTAPPGGGTVTGVFQGSLK